MSAHDKFRTNQLLPLSHMQHCMFNLREGRLCLTYFDDEARHTDITPVFFPAAKVPHTATAFKIAVALLIVGHNKDGATCVLMQKQENGLMSLPIVRLEPNQTLLDACYTYVRDWFNHDWWFKQLATIELVPAADKHILLVVYGQFIGPIISPGRPDYHWVPEECVRKMKKSTVISSDLYEFVQSPNFGAWCSLYKVFY